MAKRNVSPGISAIFVALMFGTNANAYKPGTDIDIRVRFENLEEHPEYTFFLKFGHKAFRGELSSLDLIELQPGTAARLKGKEVTEVFLLAMPRGKKAERPAANADENDWLRRPPEGALQSAALTTLPKGSLLPGHPGDPRRRDSEIVYRVHINGAALEATCVEWKGPEGEGAWKALAAIGVVAVLGIGVLFMLFRAFQRAVQIPPSN